MIIKECDDYISFIFVSQNINIMTLLLNTSKTMIFYMFNLALEKSTQNVLVVGVDFVIIYSKFTLYALYFYLFNTEETYGSHNLLLSYPTVCKTIDN